MPIKDVFKRLLTLLIAVPCLALAATVSVTDDTGKQIVLVQPAQRIIALSPHVVETLFVAGAGKKIVGAVEYSDYPLQAKTIPRVGGYARIDLESIIALKPDLVIAWETGNAPSALEKLRALGIPIYLSQPTTLADIGSEIEKFGLLAGTSAVATPAAQKYRAKLDSLTKNYQARPSIGVFYQISEAPLMTIGGHQIISNALTICGGKNIFAALTPMAPVISTEAVLAANPEVIMTSGMAKLNPTGLDFWKKWAALTATQRNNFFFIDPDLMNRSGPRMLEGTVQVCEALQTARARRPNTPQASQK